MVYATCKNVGGFMIGAAIPWSLCILMKAAAFIVLHTVNVLQKSPTHVDSMHGARSVAWSSREPTPRIYYIMCS